jgi:hypothetical protein
MSEAEGVPEGFMEVVRGDAPHHRYPVSDLWTVVSRGIDGRYHTVVADPQRDYFHALHLAEAYTTPGEDHPDFEPDVRLVRDGAVCVLLEAVENFLAWADATGSTGDIIDFARDAMAAAVDPRIDIGIEAPSHSLEKIREISLQGSQAYVDGTPRSANPYAEGDLFHTCWDRGWEMRALEASMPGDSSG